MHKLWDACLRTLEQEIPVQQFNTWIRPLTAETGDDASSELILAAPNRFVLELVRERFAGRIEKLLIEQGANFSTTINVEDTAGAAINLYGYSASSQMRKSYYSSSYVTITSTIKIGRAHV